MDDGDLSGHKPSYSVISHYLSGNFPGVLRERQRESVTDKSSSELEILFLRMMLLSKTSNFLNDNDHLESSNNVHKAYFHLIEQNLSKSGVRKADHKSASEALNLPYLSPFCCEVQNPGYLKFYLRKNNNVLDRLNSFSSS